MSRRNIALAASLAMHCVVVFLWVNREPIFVKPSSVAWGRQGTSGTLIYLPPQLLSADNQTHPKLQFKRKPKPSPAPATTPVESAKAGTANGSMFSGHATGVEASQALPLVSPDA